MERPGYIKANKLTNEYIIRHDIVPRGEAKAISVNENNVAKIIKDNKNVDVAILKLFNIVSQNEININEEISKSIGTESHELWATISNEGVEQQLELFLSDYKLREDLIENIVKISLENKVDGINVNFLNLANQTNFERFIIELAPRLREKELSICITMDETINKDKIKSIVDYVIE